MNIGYIGLGKMGLNMAKRLAEKGHDVLGYDPAIKSADISTTDSLGALVEKLQTPRTIIIMVPHQVVSGIVDELGRLLISGDTIIEAGNSHYRQSQKLYSELKSKGINFLDAGISGGPNGARNGACVMVGGDKEVFDRYDALFKDISLENGYRYMGKSGAGHFVKMVHNGIEYGMMQAIGEGFEILKKSEFNLDVKDIADLYNHGSVISSSLVGWLKDAYEKYGAELSDISGEVSHSGEGQWTVETAKEMGIPVEIIDGALEFRKKSKGNPSYTGQVVSAQRNMFGGHDVSKKS